MNEWMVLVEKETIMRNWREKRLGEKERLGEGEIWKVVNRVTTTHSEKLTDYGTKIPRTEKS
jgi:hypothetical protein